ncbi:MAG TPA: hypothetical protein ENL03_02005 [Phycisphaerae bacterium]|nr:hypothetical protein [Phycisphaerae bacterium]
MGTTILLIVALILAACVLYLLEIITPSFGVLFVGAVAVQAIAVWQGWTIHRYVGIAMIPLLIGFSIVYLQWLVKFMPNTKLGSKIFLKRIAHTPGEGVPQSEAYDQLVGKAGTTTTLLRPAGMVQIEGKRVDALSESGIIASGTEIEVVRSEGMAVVVKAVKK